VFLMLPRSNWWSRAWSAEARHPEERTPRRVILRSEATRDRFLATAVRTAERGERSFAALRMTDEGGKKGLYGGGNSCRYLASWTNLPPAFHAERFGVKRLIAGSYAAKSRRLEYARVWYAPCLCHMRRPAVPPPLPSLTASSLHGDPSHRKRSIRRSRRKLH
jgi:hypothetical protein